MSGSVLFLLLPLLLVGPAYVVLRLLYGWHPGRRPPAQQMVQLYLLGFASTLPAIVLEVVLFLILLPLILTNVPRVVLLALLAIGIGLIEEGTKRAFLERFAVRQGDVRVAFDGVLFAVAIGLGFATVENRGAIYGSAAGGLTGALGVVAVLRLVLATPAHGLLGAIMGSYIGRAAVATDAQDGRRLRRLGLLVPATWHALYDFFALSLGFAEGTLAGLTVAGLAASVIAMWTVGIVMLVQARRLGAGLPVSATPPVPAPPPAGTVTNGPRGTTAESDHSAWARPRDSAV